MLVWGNENLDETFKNNTFFGVIIVKILFETPQSH